METIFKLNYKRQTIEQIIFVEDDVMCLDNGVHFPKVYIPFPFSFLNFVC